MTLGLAIRRLRLSAGLTQRQLADSLGIDPSHLSHVESDRKEPSLSLLRRISSEIGVPTGLLLAIALSVDMEEDERLEYASTIAQLVERARGTQLAMSLG